MMSDVFSHSAGSHPSSPKPPHPPPWASYGKEPPLHYITGSNIFTHHGNGDASTLQGGQAISRVRARSGKIRSLIIFLELL